MELQFFGSIILALLFQSHPAKHTITNSELQDVTRHLHTADVNGTPNLVLNFQGRTSTGNQTDRAPAPLFTSVPAEVWKRPTVAALKALYDNYIADVAVIEEVTNHEILEEDAFIEAIFDTDVMKIAHRFLASKALAHEDINFFKRDFKTMWFGLYSRAPRVVGSSGFEHVYLGELKNGISGLHSWHRFYLEEAAGKMNYLGYIRKVDLGQGSVVEMPMLWKGVYKPVSSISIGGSPELELALATVCFAARPNGRCPVRGANGGSYYYQTHTLEYSGVTYVGSAYPTL